MKALFIKIVEFSFNIDLSGTDLVDTAIENGAARLKRSKAKSYFDTLLFNLSGTQQMRVKEDKLLCQNGLKILLADRFLLVSLLCK